MYDLFADFFNDFDIFPVINEEKRCPNCGKTYYDFQKTGKFGCGECYNTFSDAIKRTLRQIQSAEVHIGKIPSKQVQGISQKRKLEELKTNLAKAVASEDYELAAKIHKEIKQLEG